ncbi:MAG: hypothetical protein Q9162_006060 [Coniocarpon cinnabarinum]
METGDASDEVYALVYSLSGDDERRLDRNEGVPWAYQKNLIEVEFWKAEEEGMPVDVGDQSKMERKQMLVYMDENGLIEDEPRNEYVFRMGIDDAIHAGVPVEYVQRVMRRYIPEMRARQDSRMQLVKLNDERQW